MNGQFSAAKSSLRAASEDDGSVCGWQLSDGFLCNTELSRLSHIFMVRKRVHHNRLARRSEIRALFSGFLADVSHVAEAAAPQVECLQITQLRCNRHARAEGSISVCSMAPRQGK